MKAPKLKQNESTESFKKRVAEWERVTGKPYPMTFGGNSDEERVLRGETRMFGLDKPKTYTNESEDWYTDPEYESLRKDDAIRNYTPPTLEDQNEDFLSRLARGEVDPSETVLPEPEVDDTAPLGGRYNPGIELGQIAGGDQTMVLAGMDAKIDRQYVKDKMSVKNQAAELKQLNTATNNTYVTDYQTAMKQGVPQFYGEDTLAEGPYGEKRMKKSNVFTEAAFDWGQYKEGDTLGVMGRGQREAYDRAFHEWEMKQQVENNQSTEPKKEDVKSNTNETKLTSEQTGKLPDTAGKPGTGVIDPPTNIKSPLDDPLFNVV